MEILDTDTLAMLVRPDAPEGLQQKIAALTVIYTTAINLAELQYGLERQSSEKLREIYETVILPNLTVLAFDEAAAIEYGRLRGQLESKGISLNHPDLLIASIALSQGATLVTRRTEAFECVTGLEVADWSK